MSGNEAKEHAAHISDLQESFSKQQKKISVLKELVQKSEAAHGKSTSSAQEKVKNIAQRLTHLKAKARSRQSTLGHSGNETAFSESKRPQIQQQEPPLQKLSLSFAQADTIGASTSTSSDSFAPLKPQQRSESSKSLSSVSTSSNEKVLLLRQQMEQNKALMAQRASSKQHLEQLVSQLKDQFDTTQQCLEDTTELGKSMSDLSALVVRSPAVKERHKSATDLSSQPFSLERERIKFLENRCRLLEKQLEKERQGHNSHDQTANETPLKSVKELENKVLELEKSMQGQESKIAARDIEIGKLSTTIAEKDEEIFMLRTGERIVSNESNDISDLGNEIERLRNENAKKEKRIIELEQINDVLETTRCDLTAKNSEIEEQLLQLRIELNATSARLQNVNEELERSRAKCHNIENALAELQNNENGGERAVETDIATDSQVNAEMAKQIQELQSTIHKLNAENSQLKTVISEHEKIEISDINIAEKVTSLEATIESQRVDLTKRLEATKKLEEELMEKTIELNVLNANFKVLEEKLETSNKNKPLFSSSGDAACDNSELRAEIQQLKQKLDESNKAMIKLKLKCKQSEKQVEKLKKSSDLHADNVKLEMTIEQLQQKITELEDEKGQWQLSQMDASSKPSKEVAADIEASECLCKTYIETIRLLEEEKFDQLRKLESTEKQLRETQEKLNHLDSEKSARVMSEISEINLEEQLEQKVANLRSLQERFSRTEVEAEEYKQKLEVLHEQKAALEKKLEHYIVENMELLDKLEKLSKSSSSAESIEIVERLTQQERAEIDEFNKQIEENVVSSVNELTQTEMGPELSENLTMLREESSELMNKIELFTNERREVLEKMENLNTENYELLQKIEELTQQKTQMEMHAQAAESEKRKLEEKLEELVKEKDLLASEVAEFKVQKAQLSQELTSLQKSSEVVAALDSTEGATLFEKCEKSLSKLNSELESYRRASDKNAKFNASKKLAKEAKNAYTQLSELLQKVKEASTAVETVTVVETVVAVTAPNGKALAEYEQLTAQNRELKATVDELRRELQDARESTCESCVATAHIPAITEDQSDKEKLQATLKQLSEYKEENAEWQSKVEDLRNELERVQLKASEKSEELEKLKKIAEDNLIIEKQSVELKRLQEVKEEEKLKTALENLRNYEEQCMEWQAKVEQLHTELRDSRLANEEKTNEISQLNEELNSLRKISENFDNLMKEKQLFHEQEVAELTLLRRELENKCETYEGEIGILQTLVAEQKQQLIESFNEHEHELNLKLLDLQKRDEQISELRVEVKNLKMALEAASDQLTDDLRKECEKLRESLKISKALVTEQVNELSNKQETIDTLNQQITDLYKTIEENTNKVIEKEDELAYYQELIETNNKEQDRLRKDNDEQKSVVDKLLIELHSHKENAQQLTQVQSELMRLENENKKIDHLNRELEKRNKEQLEKLKKYAANLKKRSAQCQELELKVQELEKGALEALQSKDVDVANEVNTHERIIELEAELAACKVSMNELTDIIQKKTAELAESSEQCTSLKAEIDQLRNSVAYKNELVESLEKQIKETNIQKTDEIRLLQDKLKVQDQRLSEVNEELKLKSLKFEKSKAVIKERNNQIHRLQSQIKDLQDKLSSHPEEEFTKASIAVLESSAPVVPHSTDTRTENDELKLAYENLSEKYNIEKTNFQETIARLETLHDGIQAKLHENMSYIDTLEHENAEMKEKMCKLEECIATFEERRASIDRKTNILCAQMQSREMEYEKTEDELIHRVNMLSERDEIMVQRLLQSQEEIVEQQERLEKLQAEIETLNAKYAELQQKYQSYCDETESNLETELAMLREKLAAANAEIERSRSIFDAKLAAKTTEIDEIECELNEQVEKTNNEKRSLKQELEKSRDECNELKDEIVRLKESLNALEQVKVELERESTWLRMQSENSQQDQYELQELRMQTMHDKTEIENLRHQIETLTGNHEAELQALRTQISELDTLRMQVGQNQTDDQVFIETENKRLTDLLAEKETVIENYQRQNLQLQMAAAAAAQPQAIQHDPLALAFGVSPQNVLPFSNEERERWQQELHEKNDLVARLQRDLSAVQADFHNMFESNSELQRQVAYKNQEIETLRHSPSRSVSTPFTNDVIPAPPLFFTGEQITPSPFDEIIQARRVEEVEGTNNESHDNDTVAEHPTIEDLQRNVSDLEKHAQDLENKLAIRNKRELELEERINDMQSQLKEIENQLKDRELQLKSCQLELHNVLEENAMLKCVENTMQQEMENLKMSLDEAENQQKKREIQIRDLEMKLDKQERANSESKASEMHDLAGLEQLQSNLQHLQGLLRQRDEELSQLKNALDSEKELKESMNALESQIIPESLTNLPVGNSKNPVPTLEMFFGGSAANEFENLIIPPVSNELVVEEPIVPRKAYVCYPESSEAVGGPTVKTTDLELGDGWGDTWDTREAKAEAEHFSNVASTGDNSKQPSLITREQELEIELQEKNEHIQELQLAIERCERQKQELQVKSGKLMKKLKEYKIKIDNLQVHNNKTTAEADSFFGDLDSAIQDELKAQVERLEAKLEEERKINANYGVEKEKLLKRIDMLAAGSEKMTEMKERQDMDVQMYQARIKELQDKLKSLEEWDMEGENKANYFQQTTQKSKTVEFTPQADGEQSWQSIKEHLESEIKNLTSEIQDINVDRQELQALLEEEKASTSRAEETIKTLQQQLFTAESDLEANKASAQSKYNNLQSDYQSLLQKYNNLHGEKETLSTELRNLKSQRDSSLEELHHLEELKTALMVEQNKFEHLQKEYNKVEEQYNELQSEVTFLRTKNEELIQANRELQTTNINYTSNNLESMANENHGLRLQKESLEKRITEMEMEISELQSITVQQPALQLSTTDELATQLQEKEAEITHLKQRIEDLMREDQTEKLVLEILTKNQEIHILKMQVKNLEDDKQELEHNLSLQITNEMQTNKTDMESGKLREKIQNLESQVASLLEEKTNMEEELKVLNNHILNSLENEDKLKAAALELDARNIEISELRKSLETLKSNKTVGSAANSGNAESTPDFVALNARWEAIVEQRCGEIAKMWRDHLEQREEEFKRREARLQEEIAELRQSGGQPMEQTRQLISAESTGISTPASESTSVSGTSSGAPSKDGTPRRNRIMYEESEDGVDMVIEQMQVALQRQEVEIATLKEHLAIRSAEYARLAAQYDPFKLQTTTSHSGLSAAHGDSAQRRNTSATETALVPKSELDLALYMLHQRDMRCEEITLELVSLLEERDTLQLKLSNTLRQVEDIKAQTNYVEPPSTQTENSNVSTTAAAVENSSVLNVTSSAEQTDDLSHKLSQLHTINHSKDKVIKEEREQRIRQMEKIQQDVAKIPSEAVSELVGSDLSHSGQSPSSVLLNWLWGNKQSPDEV